MTDTKAKTELAEYLHYGGFGRVEDEYQFAPDRQYRADWCLPEQKVIVEYEGLVGKTNRNRRGDVSNVGHASITGILRDMDKANLAQALGYRVFRFSAKQIADGSAFTLLDRVLERKDTA